MTGPSPVFPSGADDVPEGSLLDGIHEVAELLAGGEDHFCWVVGVPDREHTIAICFREFQPVVGLVGGLPCAPDFCVLRVLAHAHCVCPFSRGARCVLPGH